MKFCFRLQLRKKTQFKKYKKSSHIINLFNHYDNDNNYKHEQIEIPINESNNNMIVVNDGSSGDDREMFPKEIPTLVDEQQIANAQDKVDRLMNIITDTYEKTLIRNLRLEELDMRSTDLFRDAEKMKNMAHKMQDKFFWEDSKLIMDLKKQKYFYYLFRILYDRSNCIHIRNCTWWFSCSNIYSKTNKQLNPSHLFVCIIVHCAFFLHTCISFCLSCLCHLR